MTDNTQDLNEAQYRVIKVLCGETHRNVMFVGDPNQAIFQWNGAHPKYLDFFARDFGAKKIKLNENFRSSKAVIEVARLLEPSYKAESEFPIPGEIRLIEADDEQEEAEKVVDYLSTLIDQGHRDIEGEITLERCGVLGRNRYVFNAIETLLDEQEWPYYKHLSTQHRSESNLLRDFELCLRLKANPRDRLHLDALMKNWDINDSINIDQENSNSNQLFKIIAGKVDEPDAIAVLSAVERLGQEEQSLDFLPAFEILQNFADKLEKEEERAFILQDIQEWKRAWDHFLRSSPRGSEHQLASFLGHIALGGAQQPRQDGLALLTVHSAKGLEFDVVVVMGMMEGVFPDYRARDASLEEEKRNFFVAITRSKRLLCLSYAKRKVMPWGDAKLQRPSRYLKHIGLKES